MAYSIYLDRNGNLYSDNKFVDIENILLFVNNTFVSLDGNDVMSDIGLVAKQDIIALEARVDRHTLLLGNKLDLTAFTALADLKANLNEVLRPSDLSNIITETPEVNLTATSVLEGNTINFIITNYNNTYLYDLTSDIGTVTMGGNGTIIFTANNVSVDTTGFIKISAIDGNKLISFPLIINLTIENIPFVTDQVLINTDLVANEQESLGMV